MPSHEAERCLAYLVKGGELVSEWEQKQEEKGALESVMSLALRQVLSFCFFGCFFLKGLAEVVGC